MIVPVAGRFMVCATATVIEPDAQLRAWIERHVRRDPDIRWIVGNYVEAEQANSNGHIFPLDELFAAQQTLAGKPLNMMHREHYIVGAFSGAQLLHGNGSEFQAGDQAFASTYWSKIELGTGSSIANSTSTNADVVYSKVADPNPPYVEALAGMWHRRFPEEFFNIRRAHDDGTLFFSMESIPEEISCPSCSHRAAYVGIESDTYCEHMQGAIGPKVLHRPSFNGGAIIIPPLKPGWSRADITAISKLITDAVDEAEQVHDAVQAAAPHLDARQWEAMMAQLMVLSREFKPATREKMAKKGAAMPDGSFPIANEKDLRNAIQAIGRAKNPAAVKSHIKRRARALGLSDLIPDNW